MKGLVNSVAYADGLRVGEVARLMGDAGLIVICAFISPFRAERDSARQLVESGEFFEIHIDTPLAEAAEVGLFPPVTGG